MKNKNLLALYKKYVAHNYGRLPLSIARADGAWVWDTDGKKYMDFVQGLAANILGHSPKNVARAINAQAGKLVHASNLFYTIPQGELAAELVKISFPSKALFINSGAEAVESAIKLARKYHSDNGSARYEIIAMDNSFHGRTYGALSATGQKKYHKGFAPLVPGFKHIPFADISKLKKAVTKKTAAVIIEPVQGEGGVHAAPFEYLRDARKLCDKNGILLIFDEVQCGMGRTGKWFAHMHAGVRPDIMTLAKGLGGGFPIGAMLARPGVMDSFGPGTHASTFGGGPLACAAALEVIKTVRQKKLLQNTAQTGRETIRRLREMQSEFKIIKEVRGMGLMIGIELNRPGMGVVNRCIEKGFIINCVQDNVLRMFPPLNVTKAQMNRGLKILKEALWQEIS
ncbi:MAG: acetylornithine aminotransferase [bacterium]|nr:MAG: acetylornithine aminotransferase [bacterium]